jgi:hypothetical protein
MRAAVNWSKKRKGGTKESKEKEKEREKEREKEVLA